MESAQSLNLTIFGQGYVGLVTAACLANWGHRIHGVDANPDRIAALRKGETPFHEPGLASLVSENTAAGRLSFTDDGHATLGDSDVVVIAVGTHDGNGGWQTSTILSCLHEVVPEISDDAVLVIRSTLPPEFVLQLGAIVDRMRSDAGRGPIPVVLNPEFTREGVAIRDFSHPDRVVIGVATDPDGRGVERVRALYEHTGAPILVMTAIDAAMSKLAANLFLATKISFVNEYAALCDRFGATIDNVVGAMAYDPRIGGQFLRPGIGFGGSCLPHQVTMTVRAARGAGISAPLLSAVDEINHRRRTEIVDRLAAMIDGRISDARVALLGLSFKPDTDDLRDAPSLTIARLLLEKGATVVAYDPMSSARRAAERMVPGLEVVDTPLGALADADAAALITEWAQIVRMDWREAAAAMRGRLVFDGRNALDRETIERAGLHYAAFGRGDGTHAIDATHTVYPSAASVSLPAALGARVAAAEDEDSHAAA